MSFIRKQIYDSSGLSIRLLIEIGVQVQKEACNSCSSVRNEAPSQLTRCYGWRVPLWHLAGPQWEMCETKVVLGGWCEPRVLENCFPKSRDACSAPPSPPGSGLPYKGRRRRMSAYPTPLGEWQGSQKKTTFFFLNWGCQCARPES